MKIALTKKKPWKKWSAIASFTLLMAYAGYSVSGKATKSVPLSQLSFQTVVQGDLDIYASAYGELASAKERLLTAPALGKVAKILVRPGTKVSPNTVILQLSNPRLVQEVNAAKGQLAQQLAQREAFKYEQQSERLLSFIEQYSQLPRPRSTWFDFNDLLDEAKAMITKPYTIHYTLSR
ncbi:efflux RND transporter periplasmic adaptor subunit [Colwellia sp. TT2012]|uniref:efflux RND transporter periplasmic adaptor subunit n=1 Tax=Colwellia sp. TT2012 TaxID=1720342 RepID=UPI000A4C9FBC|nr:efflux RND transporter periplasmic adaptor subunit [Colwellia sp. TT2012]